MIVANRTDMFEFFVDKKWDTNVVFDIEVAHSHQCIAMSSRSNPVFDLIFQPKAIQDDGIGKNDQVPVFYIYFHLNEIYFSHRQQGRFIQLSMGGPISTFINLCKSYN